jgi:ankyrin repeat protein
LPNTLNDWLATAHLDDSAALFAAIRSNDRLMVQKLIAEGVDFDSANEDGMTPLAIAMQRNFEGIACDLIDAGALIDFNMPQLLQRLVLAVVDRAWDVAEEWNGFGGN